LSGAVARARGGGWCVRAKAADRLLNPNLRREAPQMSTTEMLVIRDDSGGLWACGKTREVPGQAQGKQVNPHSSAGYAAHVARTCVFPTRDSGTGQSPSSAAQGEGLFSFQRTSAL
jgi:hypothetical protein